MADEHFHYWWTGKTGATIPHGSLHGEPERFTVTPDTGLDRLAYQMEQEAQNASVSVERLEQFCERANVHEVNNAKSLTEVMERMQAAIDNVVRKLNPEPSELKPVGLVRSGQSIPLVTVGVK